jgi:hypothetical protein
VFTSTIGTVAEWRLIENMTMAESILSDGAGAAEVAQDTGEKESRRKQKPGGKAGFLLDELNDRILSFQNRRKENRSKSFYIKITGTVCSALTTILVGLQGFDKPYATWLSNLALAMSASVTVLTAWESFFDHRGLWVKYTKARSQLLAIKARLEFQLAGNNEPLSQDQLESHFRDYQAVLDEVNASWLQLRNQEQNFRRT